MLLALAITYAFSPLERGQFVLYTSIAVLGTYLLGFGLVGALLHFSSSDPGQLPGLCGLALVGGIVVGGATATAGSLVTLPLVNVSGPSTWALAVGCISCAVVIHLAWLAYGRRRYLFGGVLRALPLAATAVFAALPGSTSESSALFVAWAVLHAAAAVVGLAVVGHSGVVVPSRRLLAQTLSYAIAYFGAQLGQLLSLRVDQWILAGLVSASAVGTYSLAASISELALLAISAIGVVVFSESSSGALDRSNFNRFAAWSLGVAFACALLLAFAAPVIVGILPDEYSPATELVQLLCMGVPGLVVMRLWTNRLSGLGFPWRASASSAVALLVTVGLDIPLILQYEATGAAVASVLGYTAGALTAVWLTRQSESAATTPRLGHA